MPIFRKNVTKVTIHPRSSDLSSPSSSMLDNTPAIRTVTGKDYKLAAECLADAFSKDEIAAYFVNCPDTTGWSEERKWKVHVQIMRALTYAHAKMGTVRAIGDGQGGSYDAVALWVPPLHDIDGYFAMLQNGVLWKGIELFRLLSKEGRQRFFKEFFSLLTNTKAEVLKERERASWYLVYVGTHTRARGKGLAKQLVSEVTRQCDAEDRACYLESSNIVNVPIYQKMGFEPSKKIYMGHGNERLLLDVMVREPQSAKALHADNQGEKAQVQAIAV